MDMEIETGDPKRHLTFDGAKNLRDLGGYTTADGRKTRWRKFLRSAKLDALTTAAQKELVEYGVGAVVDLRSSEEVERYPNVFERSKVVKYHHLDFWGDRLRDFKSSPMSQGQADKLADLLRTGLKRCNAVIG